MTDLIAFWKYDFYKDDSHTPGYLDPPNFNSRQRKFHEGIEIGETLWLVTYVGMKDALEEGIPPERCWLTGCIVVADKTYSTQADYDYKYGDYRIEGDSAKSQTFKVGEIDVTDALRKFDFVPKKPIGFSVSPTQIPQRLQAVRSVSEADSRKLLRMTKANRKPAHWLPSKAIIGVVHLLPLPGSPRWGGDFERVLKHANDDAQALASGGVSAIIVENFGDSPMVKDSVGAHTVASMTLAVEAVKSATGLPIGVNMLRNDAKSAIAVATATGARFIRVNVHTGVMVADEGIIEGRAAETLRYRRELESEVEIFADVLVKHAVPLGEQDLHHAARTARERGLADALIVSGAMTGESTNPEDVAIVKEAVSEVPVLIGSGLDVDSAEELLAVADGAIVGTSLKMDGVVTNPVDEKRVARLVKIAERLR